MTHDPAMTGIDINHFTPEEQAQLRIIHRRVVRDRVRLEMKRKETRMEEIVQENIALRRVLLALRSQVEPTRDNQSLLGQVDDILRI